MQGGEVRVFALVNDEDPNRDRVSELLSNADIPFGYIPVDVFEPAILFVSRYGGMQNCYGEKEIMQFIKFYNEVHRR
jgi:hypothetical protein